MRLFSGLFQFASPEAYGFYKHVDYHGMSPSEDGSWTCHWSGELIK